MIKIEATSPMYLIVYLAPVDRGGGRGGDGAKRTGEEISLVGGRGGTGLG